MPTSPVTCVFLSRTINLRKYLTNEIARLDGKVNFVDHLDGTDPAKIDMAVSWHPHARCVRSLSEPEGGVFHRRRRRQHPELSKPARRHRRGARGRAGTGADDVGLRDLERDLSPAPVRDLSAEPARSRVEAPRWRTPPVRGCRSAFSATAPSARASRPIWRCSAFPSGSGAARPSRRRRRDRLPR